MMLLNTTSTKLSKFQPTTHDTTMKRRRRTKSALMLSPNGGSYYSVRTVTRKLLMLTLLALMANAESAPAGSSKAKDRTSCATAFFNAKECVYSCFRKMFYKSSHPLRDGKTESGEKTDWTENGERTYYKYGAPDHERGLTKLFKRGFYTRRKTGAGSWSHRMTQNLRWLDRKIKGKKSSPWWAKIFRYTFFALWYTVAHPIHYIFWLIWDLTPCFFFFEKIISNGNKPIHAEHYKATGGVPKEKLDRLRQDRQNRQNTERHHSEDGSEDSIRLFSDEKPDPLTDYMIDTKRTRSAKRRTRAHIKFYVLMELILFIITSVAGIYLIPKEGDENFGMAFWIWAAIWIASNVLMAIGEFVWECNYEGCPEWLGGKPKRPHYSIKDYSKGDKIKVYDEKSDTFVDATVVESVDTAMNLKKPFRDMNFKEKSKHVWQKTRKYIPFGSINAKDCKIKVQLDDEKCADGDDGGFYVYSHQFKKEERKSKGWRHLRFTTPNLTRLLDEEKKIDSKGHVTIEPKYIVYGNRRNYSIAEQDHTRIKAEEKGMPTIHAGDAEEMVLMNGETVTKKAAAQIRRNEKLEMEKGATYYDAPVHGSKKKRKIKGVN